MNKCNYSKRTMKTKLMILIGLAAVVSSILFIGCTDNDAVEPALNLETVDDSENELAQIDIRHTSHEYFKTGAQLGYSIKERGGTTNDCNEMIQIFIDNDLTAMTKLFDRLESR